MSLEEDHQEAETNENHNVDILEHWVVRLHRVLGIKGALAGKGGMDACSVLCAE